MLKVLQRKQEAQIREKVTANKDFIDIKEKRLRIENEKFIVTKERAIELSEANMIKEKYKKEKSKKLMKELAVENSINEITSEE